MKKYIVILQTSIYGLEQSVNKMLNEGWVPVGGMVVSDLRMQESYVTRYYQAMTHEDYVEYKVVERDHAE